MAFVLLLAIARAITDARRASMGRQTRALRSSIAALVALLAPGCAAPPAPPVVDGGVVDGAAGRWEATAPLARGPRQETAVIALRGEVVVIGGFDESGNVVATVEAYDPVVDSWRALADVPVPLHHANAAVVDEELLIAGFLTGPGFVPDGRVFRYDADDDAWFAGAAMTTGAARGACGVAVDEAGGAVLLFGGSAGTSSARTSRYDVDDDAWTELADLPVPLDHLGAATIDGRIFVVGGRTNGVTEITSVVLELVDDAFVDRAPMPTARAGFAAAVVGAELFVAGGEGNVARDDGVFPQTEAYDPATDTWRDVLDMRTPRHGTGAATVAGALYVPGGADRQQFAAVDVVERFVPAD